MSPFLAKNKSCVFEIHRRLELLQQKGQTTGTIMWCPSHIGIPGNEMADQLAGRAMHLDLPIIDTPASISSIKRVACDEYSLNPIHPHPF